MSEQRSIDNYARELTDPEATAAITGQLLRHHLDQDARRRWASELADEHGVRRGGSPAPLRRRHIRRWAMAAAIALLGLAAWWVTTPANTAYDQLADQYLSAPFDYTESRKGPLELFLLQREASTAYINGDYATATQKWEELMQQTPVNESDHFYLGLCYLYQDQPEKALPQLEATTAFDHRHYREEVNWYLALAHLQAGQVEAAKAYLEQIVAEKSWNQDQASDLLRQLPR
ncbi:MAG: hypothetical protein KDC54_03165 [Lewinella sp.]|nr:hypothetical protein [Lewinella sp.]